MIGNHLLVFVLIHASRYLSDRAGKSQDSTDAMTSSLLDSTSEILSSTDKKAPSLVFKASTGRRPKEEKYLRAAFKANENNFYVEKQTLCWATESYVICILGSCVYFCFQIMFPCVRK